MTATTLTTAEPADRTAVIDRSRRSRAGVRIRRFLATYGWLARDGLHDQKRAVVSILGASMVAAFAQGAAVATIVLFVRVVQGAASTGVGAVDEILGSNVISLVLVTAALIVLYLVSAGAQYLAAKKSRRIGREYHDGAVARAFDRYTSTSLLDPEALALSAAHVRQTLARQPRIMGKALEAIVRSISPACSLVVVGSMMFLIDLKATLVLGPVFLLLLPMLYAVSHRIQHNANSYFGNATQDMASGVRECLRMADATNVHGEAVRNQVLETWGNDAGIRSGLDRYDKLLLGPSFNALATSLFRPLAVAVVLFVLGYQALDGSLSWDLLLGFLAALRLFAGYLESMSSALAQLNMFYRRVADYRLVYGALGEVESTGDQTVSVPTSIKLRSSAAAPGGMAQATLEPGRPFMYVHEAGLNRLTLAALIRPLVRRTSIDPAVWRSARFMTNTYAFGPGTIASNVFGPGGGTEAQRAEATAALRSLDLSAEFDRLPEGWDTDAAESVALRPQLQTGLKLLAIRACPSPVVFIDLRLLRGGSQEFTPRALGLIDDRYVAITTNGAGASSPISDLVVVAKDRDIAAIGTASWWQEHRDEWVLSAGDDDVIVDAHDHDAEEM